jgi:hypothetical protein
MILNDRRFEPERFEAETGWALKPEGACKGDLCIPIADEVRASNDTVAIAEAMGLPVVSSEAHGLVSIGPESAGNRALTTAAAPELELPDLEGKPFRLSSLKGQKVVVFAWAPY